MTFGSPLISVKIHPSQAKVADKYWLEFRPHERGFSIKKEGKTTMHVTALWYGMVQRSSSVHGVADLFKTQADH